MLFVSDVHGAFSALRRVVALGEKVIVLGDLANLTDYRTGEGAVADVLGIEFARESALARARGDFSAMRDLWEKRVGDAIDDVRREIGEAIRRQYLQVTEVLEDGTGYVIHGNVDRPDALRESLPGGFEYVHGRVVEVDGLRIGFVGGGVTTPLRARGEVSDEEMSSLLEGIGQVDVLCTHVPAAVRSVRRDVITGREERGSEPIRRHLESHRTRLHLFGDVHQPMASTWRVGPTRCHNAGYFRATGRYLRLENDTIHVGRVG
jgi:Icc-related predicted phosphoesterase